MTLHEKQVLFARFEAELRQYIFRRGWEVTLGEGYIGDSIDKPSEDTPHLRHGNHFRRLAQDLNLFVNGQWITDRAHPAWQEIGKYWESLHPICRWGGRFKDANHFSLEHEGVA